jgi:AraC-like DNA-binding protein
MGTALPAMDWVEVHSADQYEALMLRRAATAGCGPIRYRLLDPGPARRPCGAALTRFGNAIRGGLQLSYIADRFAMEVTFPEVNSHSVCFVVPLRGEMFFEPYASESQEFAAPGGALLCQDGPGARGRTSDESQRLTLRINAEALTHRLEALLERRVGTPLLFMKRHAGPSAGEASLRRLALLMASELADPESLLAQDQSTPVFQELVMHTLLHGVPHNYSEQLGGAVRGAAPRSVRRAEAFMREHLERPLTLAEIAAAAGCSPRSLTAAFRGFRDRTVMSALRELRLDAARACLLREDAGLTVGGVARRFGFSNPGRFSTLYRAQFGELPRLRLG